MIFSTLKAAQADKPQVQTTTTLVVKTSCFLILFSSELGAMYVLYNTVRILMSVRLSVVADTRAEYLIVHTYHFIASIRFRHS